MADVTVESVAVDAASTRPKRRMRRWLVAAAALLIFGAFGGIGAVLFAQQSKIDDLSADLDATHRDVHLARDQARDAQATADELRRSLGDGLQAARSLSDRLTDLEQALFGYSTPTFEFDLIGGLQGDVAALDGDVGIVVSDLYAMDQCIDSIVSVLRYDRSFLFC